jgi:hypothetical protein
LKYERLNKVGMKDETDEVYTLSDYKIEDENTHHGGGTRGRGDEEDEEDGGGYHKTYDCVHQ